MYAYHTTIKLNDTDAAGMLYFASLPQIAHHAFEAFIDEKGPGFKELIQDASYLLPIVHSEADYRAPLFPGDAIRVELSVERLGTSSFTTCYSIKKEERVCAAAKLVHVSLDRNSREKIALPAALRTLMEELV